MPKVIYILESKSFPEHNGGTLSYIFFYCNLYCLFSVYCSTQSMVTPCFISNVQMSACEPKAISCPIEAEYDLSNLNVLYPKILIG